MKHFKTAPANNFISHADIGSQNEKLLSDCTLCPRKCHVNRLLGEKGYCGQGAHITAARAALHMWEEPCISGTNGSGTVFFSGCNLKCFFCQNHEIALGTRGQTITIRQLVDIFLTLEHQGAHNINLVTPSHFIPQIAEALQTAKSYGLSLPIVYNTGSYETVEALQLLDGLVDIYLPDLKYHSPALSVRCCHAEDYFVQAAAAITDMFRPVATPIFDSQTGLMKRGMIVRHLLLPGQTKDSKKILRYLHDTYGNHIYISIMNQYTPLSHTAGQPDFHRRITAAEYNRVIDFALRIGIENGFFQEGETACESFIPPFDAQGLPTTPPVS